MLKRVIFLLLLILAGCSNPSAPKEGETEGKKFVRFVAEGDFSNPTKKNNYLYAEVIVNKESAGILLHELKKSGPVERFSEPVKIKMTNSSGQELQMLSARRWNSSGGILIEKNNNDYSQFRIYLLQNKGTVTIEIKDSDVKFIISA